MSGIKSALELAMERTAGLKVDPEELRRQQARKEGKVMANRWLSGSAEDEELRRPFTQLANHKDRVFYLAGVKEVLLAQVKFLNEQTKTDDRLASLVELLPLGKDARNQLTRLIDQLLKLQRQFSEHREQIKEQLTRQVEPFLRQKERQIEQQTGQVVRLTADSEPQFRELLTQQCGQLESELGPYLEQVRQGITRVLT